MVTLDHNMQRAILTTASDTYPYPIDITDCIDATHLQDRTLWDYASVQLHYLHEHGLIHISGWQATDDFIVSQEDSIKITAKGLDFLSAN